MRDHGTPVNQVFLYTHTHTDIPITQVCYDFFLVINVSNIIHLLIIYYMVSITEVGVWGDNFLRSAVVTSGLTTFSGQL